MKRNHWFFLVFSVAMMAAFASSSCKKTDDDHVSHNNATKSHNMGQNCLDCHKRGGQGEGVFKVGGTLYDSTKTTPLANGRVEFYDALTGGNLVLSLEVDAFGNFYTTNALNFSNGLYPRVVSPNGQTRDMGSAVTTGACYSCHGQSSPRIWVEN